MPESSATATVAELSNAIPKSTEFVAFPESALAEFAVTEAIMGTALLESPMTEAMEERPASESAVAPAAELEPAAHADDAVRKAVAGNITGGARRRGSRGHCQRGRHHQPHHDCLRDSHIGTLLIQLQSDCTRRLSAKAWSQGVI
jgi:hypothetical protein